MISNGYFVNRIFILVNLSLGATKCVLPVHPPFPLKKESLDEGPMIYVESPTCLYCRVFYFITIISPFFKTSELLET